jgi:hypothetical protein
VCMYVCVRGGDFLIDAIVVRYREGWVALILCRGRGRDARDGDA